MPSLALQGEWRHKNGLFAAVRKADSKLALTGCTRGFQEQGKSHGRELRSVGTARASRRPRKKVAEIKAGVSLLPTFTRCQLCARHRERKRWDQKNLTKQPRAGA
jgi:hypothetical protein